MTILLMGGRADPNLKILAKVANANGISIFDLRATPSFMPSLSFDPEKCQLRLEGRVLAPNAAFFRGDVFSKAGTPRYKRDLAGSLTLLRGWVSCNPNVYAYNKDVFGRSLSLNKPAALAAANSNGFQIPKTRVGNHKKTLDNWLQTGEALIQKPVAGGKFCRRLTSALLDKHTSIPPVIAQTRIAGADLRVFRAGDEFFGFKLYTDQLDYREDKEPKIVTTTIPDHLVEKLKNLTDLMGLNWSATDFKICPERGPVYLETNSNPMFAAFDHVAGGALSKGILRGLQLL